MRLGDPGKFRSEEFMQREVQVSRFTPYALPITGSAIVARAPRLNINAVGLRTGGDDEHGKSPDPHHSRLQAVPARDVTEPVGAWLGSAELGPPINLDQPKRQTIACRPLEVVERRPVDIAADIQAVF